MTLPAVSQHGPSGVLLPDAATLAALAAAGVAEIAATRPGPLALLCEHGGNAVPAPWADLGLPPALLASHFGYDPGAAALTRALAARLGAPAAIGRWSRLFLDLNRLDQAWECTRPDCSGIPVPGNLDVTADDLAARLAVARTPFDVPPTGRSPGATWCSPSTPARPSTMPTAGHGRSACSGATAPFSPRR